MLCHNIRHNLAWDVTGKVKPCNWLDTFPGKTSVSELLASPEFQQLDHDNQNDTRNAYCQKCWDKESLGAESKRQTDNRAAEIYLKLRPNFLKIDAAIGDKCNAACVTCNPQASSGWQKELWQTILPVRTNQELWQHIYDNRRNLIQLDFGGGEPWLNDLPRQLELYQILVQEDLAKHIKIRYNTNGSLYPKQLINFFDKFREVEITLSLDDCGNRFEYNRWPLQWNAIHQNLNQFVDLEQKHAKIKLTVNYTVSVFTFLYFESFVKYSSNVLGLPRVSPSVLHTPIEYNIKSMPQSIKDRIPDSNVFYNLISTTPLDLWKEKFWQRVNELDIRRGLDFKKTFPELYHILT